MQTYKKMFTYLNDKPLTLDIPNYRFVISQSLIIIDDVIKTMCFIIINSSKNVQCKPGGNSCKRNVYYKYVSKLIGA